MDTIVTMTIWQPDIANESTPRYIALADSIERDVAAGVLEPGARLPTHRELAELLGVTVGTVSRGYAEAERRGLTVGEVGRGTFVRPKNSMDDSGWAATRSSEEGGVTDLSLATPWLPTDGRDGRQLQRALREIATGQLDELLAYQPETALLRHRTVMAQYLTDLGAPVTADQVVVTLGAQHALSILFSTFLRPGDTLLLEELTYPGAKAAAQRSSLRLHGVELDDQGITPEGLDKACRDGAAKALYCVPTVHNPTCATMSGERRREIAEVARRHDLLIFEDEVHARPGNGGLPAIASFAPERTVFIATLSKTVTFGLRIGIMGSPSHLVERLRSAVRSSIWMAPPLVSEIATRWMVDGTADKMADEKSFELRSRQQLVQEILGREFTVKSDPEAGHCWLELPPPWRSEEFVLQARQRGVLVAGAEAFAVGRQDVPHAVRIAVASPRTSRQLAEALHTLADVLRGTGESGIDIL